MSRTEGLARIAASPTGHLATVRPDGSPHVVVITFAVSDASIVTAIDHKPKTSERLQRLVNIETNPSVSFLVDYYHDDWVRLWWVRVDGTATIHTSGATRDRAVEALAAKYANYLEQPPQGPVIVIAPERVSSWEGSG